MIRDLIDILSSGEWMSTQEIADRLKERDPVRYRTMCRQYVGHRLRKLRTQNYPLESDEVWDPSAHDWVWKVRMAEASE